MKHYKIITSGMKIKEIRKKYKINQDELSRDRISRNLISIIENNKVNLTQQTAEIIIENLNVALQKRGINFKFNSDYLLENVRHQIKNILEDFQEKLKASEYDFLNGKLDDALIDVEEILNTYNLSKEKFTIYRTIGDIYDKNRDYNKAYTYYIKAYENITAINDDVEAARLILNLGYFSGKLKRYEESIHFNKLAYSYIKKIPAEMQYNMKFNNAIAYKNLKKYNHALSELELIEKEHLEFLSDNPVSKFDVLILKANCLKEMKQYTDSINIYLSILDNLDNEYVESQFTTICNLIEVYLELNDSKNIRKYIDKSLSRLKNYDYIKDKKYECQIYNDIAKGLVAINRIDDAIKYYLKSLYSAKENKNTAILLNDLEKLLDIYVELNDTENINNLKNQFCEAISLKLLEPLNYFTLKLIDYYNKSNDRESIEGLIKFITINGYNGFE